ncbi:MAG: molybdopterin-dependent oxidoreductase [Acidobacteriota bacterium]|nr:molybdopterin-dependent oxidoreductase [Acidobacteriota bacterium]
MSEAVRTNCRLCGYLCALTAQVEDGRVVSVEPDPTRYPYDASIMKGCRRWRANVEILNHPQRMNVPLKRLGARGEGRWQEIPWEQALDEIAERLAKLKQRFGAETVATSIGGPHATYWPMHRFLNLFGSPNNVGIGQICWNPAIWMNTLTFGWPIDNDLDPGRTSCAIVWGTNPAESDNSLFWRSLVKFAHGGGTLIVVDPRRTRTASMAKHWLAIKPATDSALALGLLHVIVFEQLYDAAFVGEWCTGFAELREHLREYTPQRCAEITGLEPSQIVEAARAFAAARPSTVISGRGIDQIGVNSIATHRCLAILKAITGNVDIAGANHLGEMPDFTPETDLELSERLSEEQKKKQLGRSEILLQTYAGYRHVAGNTQKSGKRLPHRYLTSAHPNLVWRAMITGKPYPIRSLFVMGCNPLLTQADTHLIYEALCSLDLLVVLEYFKTPTAMLADYILPSAGGLERSLLQTNAGVANIAYGGPAAIPPRFDRHTDFAVWRGLGMRLGQAADWPWETFDAALNDVFHSIGLTWDEFCAMGLYAPDYQYEKYRAPNPATGLPTGFSTPSGKIELRSQVLAELGYEALPSYRPPHAANPSQFPLELITGARFQPFYASSFRQIESLRKTHPHPWAEMSVETAAQIGAREGDAVLVETASGRGTFLAHIAKIRPGVVSVEYGWWFPEQGRESDVLESIWNSNANCLTNANFENCEPLLRQWTYNGLPCRVTLAARNSLPSEQTREGLAAKDGSLEHDGDLREKVDVAD